MDDIMKQAMQAVRDAELAKRTAPAGEQSPTIGDAMDPAAGSTVSPQEPPQGSGIMDMLGGVANAGMETVGRLMRGEADPSFVDAVKQSETQLDNTQIDQNADPSLHQKVVATMAAIPTGAVKAGYEAVDGLNSLYGADPGPKSEERTSVERLDASLRETSMAAGLSSTLSSFTVGLLGAGKILAPVKAVTSGRAATVAYETAKGALAGFFSLNPHEERLSNIIQSYPSLQNPVNDFLSAKEDDGEVEGRLKNALEGVGMDLAVAGLFAGGVKVIKLLRAGKTEEAKVATEQLAAAAEEVQKPRVRVQAVGVPVAAAEKPRVRVKAGSSMEAQQGVDQAIPQPDLATNPETTGATPQLQTGEASTVPSNGEPQGQTPGQGGGAGDQVGPQVDPQAQAGQAPQVPPVEAPKSIINLSDSEVSSILSGTKADLEAIDKAGGFQQALDAGYRLSSMAQFPYMRIVTGEDADILIENAVKASAADVNKMRGGEILSDAAVQSSLRDIAKTYSIDPQTLIGEVSQAGDAAVESVRRMEAGQLIFRKLSLDVTDAVKKFNAGQFAEFGGEAAASQEIKRRLNLMMEVYGNTQAIVANAGRVVRRQRREFNDFGQLLSEMNKVDDATLFKKIEEMDANPEMLKEAVKPGFWRRVLEESTFSMRNGLLWLYPSHVWNVTGNVLISAIRPLETAIGSLFVGSKASYLRSRALKEYLYMSTSVSDGFKAAAKTFMEADSRLAPHSTDLLNGAEISTNLKDLRDFKMVPVKDVGDLWVNAHTASSYLYRNVSGVPSRVMGAQDEFFKTVRYRGLVQANAAIEGAQQGLKGNDLKDFIQSRLNASFDESGAAMDPVALKEAQAATLNSELLPGTLGATVRNARGQHPWVGLVLPYVKTPINALRYAHKYTPLLNLAQKEFRDAIMGAKGVEEQARAAGQMSLGMLFMANATLLAAQGKITGGGPTDKRLRKMLTDDGWRPYSVPVKNEDGTTTYVPFNRMDPVSAPFAMAADCYDGYRSGGDMSSVMWACTLAIGKNLSEKGFTLNLQTALEAFNDPEAKGATFLGRTATGMIPASSALRGYVNQDPYMREARSIVDITLKDMPGYSDRLPIHRDPFGDPVMRHIGVTSTGTDDLVNQENDRMILESGFGVTPPSPTRDGVDLRDVTLEDGQNAYDRFQEISSKPDGADKPLKSVLADIIQSEDYQNLLDGPAEEKGSKLFALQSVIRKYQEAAYKQLLSESGNLKAAVLNKKYAFTAKAADKANGGSSASDMLQSLINTYTNN